MIKDLHIEIYNYMVQSVTLCFMQSSDRVKILKKDLKKKKI